MQKSDWARWSAIAEILSAIAIVLTLVYLSIQTQHLAVQTEQNNKLLSAQAQFNMFQNRVWLRDATVLNPEIAELRVRAENVESLSDLSEADLLRARAALERQFLSFQLEFRHFVDGNLAREQLHFSLPSGGQERELWEYMKSSLDPDFVEWMEGGQPALAD